MDRIAFMKSVNFEFLRPGNELLANLAGLAEAVLHIDPGSATPLYQQVAADIRRRIVSGEMPVGTQLQPHRELATSYGVSIMTINKALAGLVAEGVLHSRVGRGTFVAVRPAPAAAAAQASADRRLLGFVLRALVLARSTT